jgi:D-3-phosphoglycerate dehydrogenase
MAKILISDKLAEEGISVLKEAGFIVDCKYGLTPEELKKIIGEYEAIVIRSGTKLTKEIIESANRLKVIGRAGVGLDNIDVDTATKKGIIVMNAPGGNTISTCEHTFALMFAIARNVPFAHLSIKKREWQRSKFKGVELYSKVLGIIGLGRIGKEVAKRAVSFGMSVLAYDPFVSQEVAERLSVKLVDLDELLRKADFVTLHIPLTEETKNIISHRELSLMKQNAFIINCARGGIIDEEALYTACKSKRIAGAVLDVFSKLPPFDSKILELDNVFLTPHLGASTDEAQFQVAVEVAYCIKDALFGKAIRNAVNYVQYVQIDPETYKVIEPYFNLAEKMGKFISQIIKGGTIQIQIFYLGEISSYNVDFLSSAFMKGFLFQKLEENVNYINALSIAKERAIKVEQIKKAEEEEYVNSIRVKVVTDREERVLEGTLFANKDARFVKMDNLYIEVSPSKYMLVINNLDKPGVIGFLGTVLGSHNINIAGMSLGRRAPQDIALTILNLDNPLNEKVIKEISNHPNIVSLKFVKL